MRTILAVLLFTTYVAASTITAAQQKILYSAPSYFFRPDPAFLWDEVGRVIAEVKGNDIFVFDVTTGTKRFGNPGTNWAIYNGAFVHNRVLYLWAGDKGETSMYLLKYNVDSLSSK